MRKSIWKTATIVMALPAVLAVGCVSSQGPTTVKERETGVATADGKEGMMEQLTCSEKTGTKISLGSIDCKSAACQSKGSEKQGGLFALLQLAGVPSFEGIGDGLQDMFSTAIRDTDCFRVFDRKAMEAVQQERALSGQTTALEGADYIVMGSVTSINFEYKSGSLGGGFIPVIGLISSTKQTATLGMDMRLVDAKTGEVVYGKAYTAESGKTSYGVGGFGAGGGVGFGGAMSGLSGTAMEEVARDIVVRASYDIAKKLAPADRISIRQIAASSR